jgi:hypothetical protein
VIYAAAFGAVNSLVSYLTDHCCQGRPELCKPKTGKTARRAVSQKCI